MIMKLPVFPNRVSLNSRKASKLFRFEAITLENVRALCALDGTCRGPAGSRSCLGEASQYGHIGPRELENLVYVHDRV